MMMANEVWTDDENDLAVAHYFQMLLFELHGQPFNKAEFNRKLQTLVPRNRGSIEFKHQNISAVLMAMGQPFINGYKPLIKYQSSLEDAVGRWFSSHPNWLQKIEPLELSEASALYIGQPPTLRNTPPPDELDKILATARKFDVAGRDERNRQLGKSGEEFVLSHEKQTLKQSGHRDLADKVRWVSQEDGDGAGYDISSFDADGRERLIEVKTTNGWERTPFYISRNELEVANAKSDCWHLVRLWDFARTPKAFELHPPLDAHVSLMPTSFQATFH